LREGAEEAVDIRLAHRQIERAFDDEGLHPRDPLGTATRSSLTRQRGAHITHRLNRPRFHRAIAV
jgi:hypothetical protein